MTPGRQPKATSASQNHPMPKEKETIFEHMYTDHNLERAGVETDFETPT